MYFFLIVRLLLKGKKDFLNYEGYVLFIKLNL